MDGCRIRHIIQGRFFQPKFFSIPACSIYPALSQGSFFLFSCFTHFEVKEIACLYGRRGLCLGLQHHRLWPPGLLACTSPPVAPPGHLPAGSYSARKYSTSPILYASGSWYPLIKIVAIKQYYP
jgi:hypothetical protein